MSELLHVPKDKQIIGGDSKVAIDFGGSVIKIVYIQQSEDKQHEIIKVQSFPNHKLDETIAFIKETGNLSQITSINTTGLGIQRCGEYLSKGLGVKLNLLDEMVCFSDCFKSLCRLLPKHELVYEVCEDAANAAEQTVLQTREVAKHWTGNSAVKLPMIDDTLADDFYKWSRDEVDEGVPYAEADPDLFPCGLVLLGSSLAFLKIDKDGTTSNVEFSPRGGRMLLSMASLVLGVTSFDEIISLAEKGDGSRLNVTAADAATRVEKEETSPPEGHATRPEENGEQPEAACYSAGMQCDIIVYSFGKLAGADPASFRKEDVMRAIVDNVVADLAYVASSAAEVLGLSRVFLCGSLTGVPLIREQFTRALGARKVMRPKAKITYNFLKHGGHYGAIGALFAK